MNQGRYSVEPRASLSGTKGVAYWDRGRPARPERGTERSGVQREKPLAVFNIR